MPKIHRFDFSVDQADEAEGADRQTTSLAGLAVTLCILVVCLFLVKQLHYKTMIEDCLLSGNPNCDALIAKFH